MKEGYHKRKDGKIVKKVCGIMLTKGKRKK
jgi:hypothetical protein